MSPQVRRESIIEAAKPLLATYGTSFTTKQVAEAAGIAEGTIFRVFENKQELLVALVDAILDPSDLVTAIEALPPADSIEQRVAALVELIMANFKETGTLFMALFSRPDDQDRQALHSHHNSSMHEQRRSTVNNAIRAGLEPFEQQLNNIEQATFVIRSFAIFCAHPKFHDQSLTNSHDIAHLILHGLLAAH